MLVGSDCGLNMWVGFDDSLQKVLTKTILTQEEIFRNQVLELHRLYKNQTILMKELDLNVRDGDMPNSFFGPSSKNLKYEPSATDMKLSEVHTICSSGPMPLQKHSSKFKHQRIALDLELPASHYTNYSEYLLFDSLTPEVSVITKHDLEPSFCGADRSCKNAPARRKLFSSHEVGEFDLNEALPDESSSGVSHNEVGEYGKDIFFTVLHWQKPKNSYSNESSTFDRKDTTNSTLMTSPRKDTDENICGSTFSNVDLGSVCGPHLDASSCSVDIRLKACRNLPLSETNVEKNKHDKVCSQSSSQELLLEGTDSNRSPVSCKSDSINEMKSQPSDQKKEKMDEVDRTVRAGAVSLVYFSLECSSNKNQDQVIIESKKRKECSNNKNDDEKKDDSQSLSESYESIVLREPECNADDYGVTSALSEVTISDRKDHGMKLRRGRRMKDFRKEILPNLASLSREEICEDIKVMELASRSREYKKYKSKNVRGSDCVSSVRSRRSRVTNVGRRYYS